MVQLNQLVKMGREAMLASNTTAAHPWLERAMTLTDMLPIVSPGHYNMDTLTQTRQELQGMLTQCENIFQKQPDKVCRRHPFLHPFVTLLL